MTTKKLKLNKKLNAISSKSLEPTPPINDLHPSDMDVAGISDSLQQTSVDLIVSGSIAAVESVRVIRALRRLGAKVTPWLTEGGSQFVTPLSLSWAAHQQTRSQFSGVYSHLATDDFCIVAPASANFITQIALGLSNTAPLALVQSYLGSKKKVFFLPTMHGSLWKNETLQQHISDLKKTYAKQIHFIDALEEEGKLKLPSAESVADITSHLWNQDKTTKVKDVLITLGGNREAIDPVRFITNISSGKTGSVIAEELYRQGFQTHILAANSQVLPRVYSHLKRTYSHAQMLEAVQSLDCDAAVCAAAIADYTPAKPASSKIASEQDNLELDLVQTKKLLPLIKAKSGIKIAFKLETSVNYEQSKEKLQSYLKEYDLSAIVFNQLQDVEDQKHSGVLLAKNTTGNDSESFSSKQELASYICKHIKSV